MGKQKGSVIVVCLWLISLFTILVAVMASEVRLSSRVVFNHQESLIDWSNVMTAVNHSEMELMLERMARPVTSVGDLRDINRNPLYRYNGGLLRLNYPVDEEIAIRIYDHAGKINLRTLSVSGMRALLEKRLGEDADEEIDGLLGAWIDWQDLNNASSVNGAESAYYESLEEPYSPRNGRLESVEEIMNVRGFRQVFADIDINAAFTLYTEHDLINLNLATIEAMRLLPGLDDQMIEEVLEYRQEKEFRGNGDVAQIIPAEGMAKLRPWLGNSRTSDFYTIAVYPMLENEISETGESINADSISAYSEIVRVDSFLQRPVVIKVTPYGKVPLRWLL